MKTKQAILQVAADFFSEVGYRETSMSDVAKRVGIADGTVFYNYHSKEALYLAVLDSLRTRIEQALDEHLQEQQFETGLDMIQDLVLFYINLADTMPRRFLMLHRYDPYKIAHTNPEFHKHLEAIYDCIIDALEKAIVRGQQDGSIVDVPARKYAFIVFAMADGLLRLKTFSLYQTESLYSEITQGCRRMLATETAQ